MIYSTDVVTHIAVTPDNYGGETTVTTANVPARVEDTNELLYNNNGTSEKAKSLILVSKKRGAGWKLGDRLKIDSIMSVSIGETLELQIKKIMPAGGFGVSHYEVYV